MKKYFIYDFNKFHDYDYHLVPQYDFLICLQEHLDFYIEKTSCCGKLYHDYYDKKSDNLFAYCFEG